MSSQNMTAAAHGTISPWLRTVCLMLGIVFFLSGLGLFLFAESVATLPEAARGANLWPWLIGPLLIRFVAAGFLAWTVAAFLLSRRFDAPTLLACTSFMIIVVFFLLLHMIVNRSAINWSKPLAPLWTVTMAMIFLSGIVVAWRLRSRTALTSPPLPPTPAAIAWIEVFISILTGMVGGVMFFLPGLGLTYWPWDLVHLINVQFLGALFLSVSVGVYWVWRQPSWYGYDILFATAGTFAAVALVASFIHWNLFAAHPITSWVFVAIYVLGAVLGYYPYFRYARRPENRPASPAT